LKYLKRFLDQREKKIIFIAFFASILTAVSWFGFELATHLKFVPKDGGTYSEALIGQPKYVNPLFSSINDVDSDLTKLVYAGLFNYDKNQKLAPELAEKYTISPDKKIYTISLKDSLRWSDGEPITADDVMYTFEMIQNQETGSPLYISFQGIQIEKIDNKTIRFTLKEPFAPFLHSLTVGILPEHTWAPSSQINPANTPKHLTQETNHAPPTPRRLPRRRPRTPHPTKSTAHRRRRHRHPNLQRPPQTRPHQKRPRKTPHTTRPTVLGVLELRPQTPPPTRLRSQPNPIDKNHPTHYTDRRSTPKPTDGYT
jgi:ABC-type transport system substrate-binding protein